MDKDNLTLIDAFNQFWTACGDGDRRALSCAGLTYFYLSKVWNATGRPLSFRRQNTVICAELCISKPTLESHRNTLRQSGLIDFHSKGRGDPNITYKILARKPFIEEVKKANNFTTSFTSSFTTNDAYKQSQSKEKEFFVVVSGEIKNFIFFESLFSGDAGLQACYEGQGLPAGKFSSAVERWIILNQGKEYDGLDSARRHFLFWLPYYQTKNKNYGTKQHSANRKPDGTNEEKDLGYAAGL